MFSSTPYTTVMMPSKLGTSSVDGPRCSVVQRTMALVAMNEEANGFDDPEVASVGVAAGVLRGFLVVPPVLGPQWCT